MGSYRLFGVHEWATRLATGLVGVLTIAVVYDWGRRTLGPRAALAAGLVLCLTPEFVYRGRMVTPNGLLGLFTTAALACGHLALRLKPPPPQPPPRRGGGDTSRPPLSVSGRGLGGGVFTIWWL